MVFKTLHWYILRELLRIFILTASSLDVLVALCGVFRPLTKQGLEISQLLTIMINMMPAMLAYTIPIAALFAAVFVYWRLSTDNELTACRASGISFVTIVMPALFMGLTVAFVNLVFVNYVVPVFAHRVERVAFSDLSGLMVSQINRQEKIQYKNYTIYADNASRKPSTDPNVSIVVLDGPAMTILKGGKPTQMALARQCTVTFTHSTSEEADTEVTFSVVDTAAYDPKTFKKYSGSPNSLEPMTIPSLLKSKPKFFNISTLWAFEKDPTSFQPVKDIINKIEESRQLQAIASDPQGAAAPVGTDAHHLGLLDQWKLSSADGKPLTLEIAGDMPGTIDRLDVQAPQAVVDVEGKLTFSAPPGKWVKIEQYHAGKLVYSLSGRQADLTVSTNQLFPESIDAFLELKTDVTKRDIDHNLTTNPLSVGLSGLILPKDILDVPPLTPLELLKYADQSKAPSMLLKFTDARDQIQRLFHTIASEVHSRGSFAVSCFTLVLLGAALGILLRGKNPLAVFVVGFVPAAFLVLLITAGRQLAESGSQRNVPIGISLIWAGNAIIFFMIVGVYAKLLRH